MEVITTNDGENYAHRTLRHMTRRLFQHARDLNRGAQLDAAAAMVFAAMTFEAYVNYLGFKLDPVLWEGERRWNWEKRVGKAFALCGLPVPDRTRRSYSHLGA